MAPTLKSLTALEKSKEAVSVIKERLIPVLQHLTDDSFGNATGRAQASVALSVGMMRYMSARIRGLDHGRKVDDPLRKDLNNMKRILAKLTKKSSKTTTTTTTNIKKTTPSKSEGKTKEEKDNNIVETPNEKEEVSAKKLDPVAVQVHKPKVNDKKAQIRSSKRGNTNNDDKRKKSPAKKAKKSPAKKARK